MIEKEIPKDYVASAFKMFDIMLKTLKSTVDQHKTDEEFLTKFQELMINGEYQQAYQMKFLLSDDQWSIIPACITTFLEQSTNFSFTDIEILD